VYWTAKNIFRFQLIRSILISHFHKTLILSYLLVVQLFAQNNQIRFDHISVEQGLSQTSVFSIVQDKTGFMWFATQDGLNRYDGYSFNVYRHDPLDSNSVASIGIRKLYVDNNGNLWVITHNNKLDRYDADSNLFIHYNSKIIIAGNKSSVNISSIVEDVSGQLWICSGNGALYRYSSEKDNFMYQKLNNLEDDSFGKVHAQCLFADSDGTIWMGTWEGLFKINISSSGIKKFQNVLGDEQSLGGNMVFDITEDDSGRLWVASVNGGVSALNKQTGKFKVYRNDPADPKSLSSDRVFSIFKDSRSNIWIGTIDKGLDLFNSKDETFINFHHVPSLSWSISNGAIMSIYEDRSGALWFAILSGGANRFDRRSQNFMHITHDASDKGSLSQNTVLAVCADKTGALWVGTDGGGINLLLSGEEKFKHYLQNPTGFGSNSITAIYEDRRGRIWIGTDPGVNTAAGGVFIYSKKINTFIPFDKLDVKASGITAFCEDVEGRLWIGTSADGVHRYDIDSGEVTSFKHNRNKQSSISGNSVFAIYEDKYNNLWFGMVGKGLNLFNPETETFESFLNDPENPNSISSNTVWCFSEDNDGNLWMGTWGGGLNIFNREDTTFKSFTVKDGLPSNIIYAILPDEEGNLWLSTSNGLAKFNTKNFSCKNYDFSDGLQNIEFNQGAFCIGKDGMFYFGGTNGVTAFYPENITENKSVPPIVITNFNVFNKPLFLGQSFSSIKKIILSYKQNFFSFEFAALDFTAPRKNQYKYMLEGVDKSWVDAGNRRLASYTDISPGKYKFRVKGSNNDGIWSDTEATASIIITPPFWQTWWFRILAILFITGLLVVFHRYRVNKLLEVERTRVKIARDLHDDVSATITGIVYFSDAIEKEVGEKKTPMLHKLITLIHESATNVQESMSDIIWSINPENDKWQIILPKFRRYASDLCESKGIDYKIDIPESIPVKQFEMERRRNLWLVFKEMVTNAVKHSGCTELKISISIKDNMLKLFVSDNGKGFDQGKSTEGNGVKNIYERSKSLNGKIKLITEPGKGTKWELKLNL
jgi:ligand-binding sensor domain-containing protein